MSYLCYVALYISGNLGLNVILMQITPYLSNIIKEEDGHCVHFQTMEFYLCTGLFAFHHVVWLHNSITSVSAVN